MRLKLMILTVLTLFFSVLLSPLVSHAAQTNMPQFCDNPNGASYRANLFPHYTGVNYRLSLDDWSTGEEVVLLAESLPYSFLFEWSPDCRYLVGYSEGDRDCTLGLIVWDAVSGEQKFSAAGFCDTSITDYPHVFWREDSSAAVFSEWYSNNGISHSYKRRFIWYPETNQQVELEIGYSGATLLQVYWDDSRNWLWSSGYGGVVAYDRFTGEKVVDFVNSVIASWVYRSSPMSDFVFSTDNTKVISYGQRDQFLQEAEAMTVYDIASGVGMQVNVERNGAGVVAMSPDNRYLVMGYTALRVWDLQNLPEDVEARLPIMRVNTGGERISALRFLDNTTVEVVDSTETATWNILTGERVS